MTNRKEFENTKKKVVKKLEGKPRTYRLYWVDEINKSITIEAKDEEEARKMFFDGNIDFGNENEGDINYVDGSLEIEEED